MSDPTFIAGTVVLGIIIVLFSVAIIGLNIKGENQNAANFILILSFFLIVVVIAIPFIEINTQLAGTTDTRVEVQKSMKNSIGITSGLFIAFILITFMIIRKHPTKITMFTNIFTALAFLMSLVTITLFTMEKIN